MKHKPGYMIGALCSDKKENCGQAEEWRYVKEFFLHDDFSEKKMSHDVALVRLTERSTLPYATIDDGNISSNYNKGKLGAV